MAFNVSALARNLNNASEQVTLRFPYREEDFNNAQARVQPNFMAQGPISMVHRVKNTGVHSPTQTKNRKDKRV